MKKLNFYYRTAEAIDRALEGMDKTRSPMEKALINFYVLKSSDFIKNVDVGSKLHIRDIPERLENENVGVFACMRIMIKVLGHYLFYFCWAMRRLRNKSKYVSIIKTFVEVEYDLFEKKAREEKHLVLILPFPLSFTRQIKYINSMCKKPKVDFSLFGMPYSIKKLIKVLVCRNQLAIFELEVDGAFKLASTLNKVNFSNLLNMDDFDAFSVVSNSVVKSRGVFIDTHLHGIGTYSPYISTDHLKVFNNQQKNYYMDRNDISSVSFYQEYYKDNLSIVPIKRGDSIVFYSQVTNATLDLISLEKRVLRTLKDLAISHGVELFYKKHPNLESTKVTYLKELNIDLIISDIRRKINNVTGMSFYSTSFYTEQDQQAILISVPEIPVKLLFSEEGLIIEELNLHKVFSKEIT
jgi:hypothetical protein